MKFNWGTGIAIVFSSFALGMIGLVMAAQKHDPGLVQKDYYSLDLNYQDRLERKQNTAALDAQPVVKVETNPQSIQVIFPDGMAAAVGKAKFYRSTTIRDDFSVNFDNGQTLSVPAGKLASGRWHVEIEWEATGKKYFWESAFVL